jgi:hypothetical protein
MCRTSQKGGTSRVAEKEACISPLLFLENPFVIQYSTKIQLSDRSTKHNRFKKKIPIPTFASQPPYNPSGSLTGLTRVYIP